jgi:hypothetical protein
LMAIALPDWSRAVRQQVELTRPLYEKRQKVVSQIPNFWPLVIEQAPPDIDEYIQPSDSVLLLASLTSLSVSQFEIENGGQGHPRSFAIRWEFSENDYFEDRVLEKRFWYRRARDGEVGYVSEPVPIRWKQGKDLTGGLLALAIKVWEEELAAAGTKDSAAAARKRDANSLTPTQKSLKRRIENSGLGGISFFAWFGYRGKAISAEEDALVMAQERERKRRRLDGDKEDKGDEGEDGIDSDAEIDDGDDKGDDEEEEDVSLEIFPNGDELALAITGDLWPGAIKYFSELAADNVVLLFLTNGQRKHRNRMR